MDDRKLKVLLVGGFADGALEKSYASAFTAVGSDAHCFNIPAAVRKHTRLGSVGHFFSTFVPIDPWIRKANREMVVMVKDILPDVLVVFSHGLVLAGALAQIRSSTNLKMAYMWPDTLVNLDSKMISSLPLYDLVATYGESTCPVFTLLGAKRAEWVPLGGDPEMHPVPDPTESLNEKYKTDICFIGGWRPERERAITAILSRHPDRSMKIWGPDWGRRCRGNKEILRVWQGRSLFGPEFSLAVASSKINLNIIDDTNFPCANMRFFEIPCAGGLQLCSPCPEMEKEFPHGEGVFYFKDLDDLPEVVGHLLHNPAVGRTAAAAAHEKVMNGHTYSHRVRYILNKLELS